MEPGTPRDRISDLYHRALACAPEERSAFLQEECKGDAALRDELESLLRFESDSARFLETPAAVAASDMARAPDRSQMLNRQLGPYTIVAPLGAGGMGEVYRARDTKLGRDVAIKILPSHFTADPERRARFAREARLLATLNHPHIGAIHGLEESNGITALILELVEGPTLADRLARGPLPIAEALIIARQIAEALDAAHEKGIVHRDLKPANIVLQSSANAAGVPSGDVRARVLDFGLAKTMAVGVEGDLTQPRSGSLDGTAEGRILATPAYMSPEQARGQPIDKRTDIWAFGCVFYEMLTGRRAFDGDTISDPFVSILEREPDWTALPTNTPASLRTMLDRCLRKDPRKRLHDIADARNELEDPHSATSLPARDGLSRRERLAWGGACAILALFALAGARAFVGGAVDPSAILVGPVKFNVTPATGTQARGPDFLSQFALSPDGRQLVMPALSADGLYRLWLRPLASLVFQPLEGTEHANRPVWSPDGRFIAFFTPGKLKRIMVSGGPATDLCDVHDGFGVTWGTGDDLVFGGTDGLRLVRAIGGAATAVTQVDRARGELSHGWPQFLPDGRHVLFAAVLDSGVDIRVVSLDSRQVVTLLNKENSKAVYGSDHLLFQRGTNLLAQPFDRDTLKLSGEPFTLSDRMPPRQPAHETPINWMGDPRFAVSTNGVLALAEDVPRMSRLTWLDRAGNTLGTVGEPNEYGFMSLSPDGRRVAVTLGRGGFGDFGDSIWLHDVERGRMSRLTFDSGSYTLPLWSPNGALLAYNVRRGSTDRLVVRSPAADAEEQVLVNSPLAHWANDWSHDGQAVISTFDTPTFSQDLGVVPLAGDRKPFEILKTPAREQQPAVSPDGSWLSYNSDAIGGRQEVFVRPFPVTNEVHQISRDGGQSAKWRPGGGELYYIAPDGWMMSAVVYASNKGFEWRDAKKLFKVPSPRAVSGRMQQYDVIRDGSRFLMIVPDPQVTSQSITVVLNWPTLLQGR